jgi:two-component system, chemotaxis family, protein-glutamate methylesterase/glutaminase
LSARGPVPRIVALAASAGGLNALGVVLGGLPGSLSVPVVVVEHLLPDHASALASILGKRTPLSVKQAEAGDVVEPGWVYVAPPDAHTVIREGGRIELEHSPPVQFVRPSVNRLFESLAEVYGAEALVVILTGSGRDGAAGASAVKDAGGTLFVQDQSSSEHFGMPGAAIAAAPVDQVLPLDRISAAIVGMISETEMSS